MDWERWRAALGAELVHVNHLERAISAVGGFAGMLLVLWVSSAMLDAQGAGWLVLSMGASAVLLFAVPHGQLSQPWPVLGGQVLSALVGVACAQLFEPPALAAAIALAGSILAMYYLRCLHPPGGATAMTAVLGGEQVQALGYGFALTPVLLNAAILLLAAVAVNWLFPWRRYPLALARVPEAPADETPVVARADLDWALRQINSYVDVSDRELGRILELAQRHAREQHLAPEEIRLRHCYSNGRFGEAWQVRKVVDRGGEEVGYCVVAGEGRGESGRCTREEFARWARYPVARNENSWQRIGAAAAERAETRP